MSAAAPTASASDEPAGTTRCGFVAVLGPPNVGKSTLVNRLVGSKVTIVSPKAQTTRSRVLGIVVRGAAQLILIDTPGIFRPRRRLDRAMVASAWGGAGDADEVVLLVDAVRGARGHGEPDDPGGAAGSGADGPRREGLGPEENPAAIIARLRAASRSLTLVINKIDRVDKRSLLALTQSLVGDGAGEGAGDGAGAGAGDGVSATFMISALNGDGVDDLMAYLVDRLPPGPWLFPADQISDMPERLLAAEITREKLYLQLHQELPYAVAVETERWQERSDDSVRIDQVVYVLRPGQKAIVLGHGGQRIKAVGQAARTDLERLLARRVHLFIHVKVRDWSEDPERYRDLGLDFGG